MNNNGKSLQDELNSALAYYRGQILDAVEQEIGDSPRWNFLRSRLFKYLGTRGLEARLSEIALRYQIFENGNLGNSK